MNAAHVIGPLNYCLWAKTRRNHLTTITEDSRPIHEAIVTSDNKYNGESTKQYSIRYERQYLSCFALDLEQSTH